jgi:hypothetical protein
VREPSSHPNCDGGGGGGGDGGGRPALGSERASAVRRLFIATSVTIMLLQVIVVNQRAVFTNQRRDAGFFINSRAYTARRDSRARTLQRIVWSQPVGHAQRARRRLVDDVRGTGRGRPKCTCKSNL